MSSTAEQKIVGPIEDQAWAKTLHSTVVTPGPSPRIHGYDVERDLAVHYGFLETALLSVFGELPSEVECRAVERALQFAAPLSTAEAPAHVAMLVRLCGAASSASFAATTFALAESARFVVAEQSEWLARLRGEGAGIPASARPRDDDERASVARFRHATEKTGLVVAALAEDIGRNAAILTVLLACGAKTDMQLELLLVFGRLPCAAGEALLAKPTSFRTYPIDLPHFTYESPK